MRPVRALLLLLVPSLLLGADPFPAPASPERPVSDPVAGIAAGPQGVPVIASNGELALVAWYDARRGFAQGYATRIDGEGRVLDPAGILLIEEGQVEGIVWNGTHFVAVTRRDGLVPYTLVFVAPDGSIAARRVLDLAREYEFEDATGSGPGVRLLFVDGGVRAAVARGDGVFVSRDMPLAAAGARGAVLVAGSRDREFLILHRINSLAEPQQWRNYMTRTDDSGRVLSAREAGIELQVDQQSAAIEGGPDGWLIVSQHWLEPGVRMQRLDERGVPKSTPEMLLAPHPDDAGGHGRYRPRIVREQGGYALAWHITHGEDRSFTYAARVPDAGAPGPVHVLHEWPGVSMSVAFASAGGQRVVVTSIWPLAAATASDLLAQSVTAELEAGEPVPVAYTPPIQYKVTVAAGQNGYLTAWHETGGDALMRVFVRRLLPDGQPQGAPVEVAAADALEFPGTPKLASNGDTYLVTWRSGDFVYGRRMGASTGVWLDEVPFTIAAWPVVVVGSNGTDFLAAWEGDCGDELCLYARRIPASGNPLSDLSVNLAPSEGAGEASIASNGTDYLVAWKDGGTFCEFTCTPSAILALRLRADGTKLDAEPLVLIGREAQTEASSPAAAWNGGRYLVVWTSRRDVNGAFVTAEGAVSERAALSTRRDGIGDFLPRLVAWRDQFALFAREVAYTADPRIVAWTAVSFDAVGPLEEVAALPRTVIGSERETYDFGMLDAASSGPAMLVVYDRTVEPAAGGVARAFTRLFGSFGPRRRSIR